MYSIMGCIFHLCWFAMKGCFRQPVNLVNERLCSLLFNRLVYTPIMMIMHMETKGRVVTY